MNKHKTLRVAGMVAALAAVGAVLAGGTMATADVAKGPVNSIKIKGNNHPRFDAPGDRRPRSATSRSSTRPTRTRSARIPSRWSSRTELPKGRDELKKCGKIKADLQARSSSAHEVDFPNDFEIGEPNVENGAEGWDTTFDGGPPTATPGSRETEDETTSRRADRGRREPLVHVRRPPRHAGQGQGPPCEVATTGTSTQPVVGEDRRFGRRSFLAAGRRSGAAALALPVRPRLPGFGPSPTLASPPQPFKAELPVPEVLTSAQIELDMVEAEVDILPGRPTEMWTYAGSFPGPTIRRPAGEATEVTFSHELPAAAGELSVHLHGGHNTSDDDGQPGGLTAKQPKSLYCDISPGLSAKAQGNDLLIPPGGSRTYDFDADRGRRPRAGRVPVVPRPSSGQHGAKHLARARGDVDHRRRAGPRVAASDGAPRPPADDHRPLVQGRQPAHEPVFGFPARARTTGSPASRCSSTAPTSPTTTSAAAATGCAS